MPQRVATHGLKSSGPCPPTDCGLFEDWARDLDDGMALKGEALPIGVRLLFGLRPPPESERGK